MNRNVTYSKEVKQKAKQMYESGTTFAKIASLLHIKRPITVFDWRVKYSWVRNSIANSKFTFCTKEDLENLETAGRRCIAHLVNEDNPFKSNTEAIKILDLIRAFLDITVRLNDNYEEDTAVEEEKNETKNIFKLLDIKEKKTEKKKK